MAINGWTGNIKSSSSIKSGKYKYFDRSSTSKLINNYKYDGEFVIAPSEGNLSFQYVNGKFSHHQKTYRITSDNLLPKYLFYFLTKNIEKIKFLGSGTTVTRYNISLYNELAEPNINKEHQQNIINIIEPFEKLNDIYLNKLSHLEKIKNFLYLNLIETKRFSNLLFIKNTKGKVLNNIDEGLYRYYNCSSNISFTSQTNETNNNDSLIITTRGTICSHIIPKNNNFYATNNLMIFDGDGINCFDMFFKLNSKKMLKGTAIPMITKSDLNLLSFPYNISIENKLKLLNYLIFKIHKIKNIINIIIKKLIELLIL